MYGIYHSRDLDGWCSAAIIKKRYPHAKLIGFDYGDGLQKLIEQIPADSEVIMADVSLQMHEMAELAAMVDRFTWIDHHASAIKDYEKAIADEHPNGSNINLITPVLEDGISACEGTWKHLFPDLEMPLPVKLLGMYDTWRNDNAEYWNETILPFQYGMRLDTNSPETFPPELIDPAIAEYNVDTIINNGNIVLHYQRQQNEVSMKKAFVVELQGYRVLACNSGAGSTSFESVWDEEKHDAMLTFKYNGTEWVFGMYTTKDIDLSVIAKSFGGGGHKKACGWKMATIPSFLFEMGNVSDGYHTFNELYDHRITLYIAMLKLRSAFDKKNIWKSKSHSDGSVWDGWFILGIYSEPGKQITYHLPVDKWMECGFANTIDRAPDWDGHTSADVLERIKTL